MVGSSEYSLNCEQKSQVFGLSTLRLNSSGFKQAKGDTACFSFCVQTLSDSTDLNSNLSVYRQSPRRWQAGP